MKFGPLPDAPDADYALECECGLELAGTSAKELIAAHRQHAEEEA